MANISDVHITKSNYNNEVSLSGGLQLDASGRLRVSQLSTIGEYKILNSNFDTKILEQNGNATFTNNGNTITMSVTAGQYGIITSKQYHPYLNGKSQLIEFTTAKLGNDLNVEKSISYLSSNSVAPFDSNFDGIRFHKDINNIYSFQIWRGGTKIIERLRSQWLDSLDGNGISGINIDFDNFNVFGFDFLYLGGTEIRLMLRKNSKWNLVDVIEYAGNYDKPFVLSPNKPIRYEIRSTTGTGSMDFICALVASEVNIFDSIGQNISINGSTTGISGMNAGTTYAICGVRKTTTFRDIFATVNHYEGIVATNDNIQWELRLNPTVAGTFNYSALSGTPFETAKGVVTNTVTGGTIISSIYGSVNSINEQQTENILCRLNSTLNNTMDSIVLCATPILASTNITATGCIHANWLIQ